MTLYSTIPSAVPALRPAILIVDGDPDTRALYRAIFPPQDYVVEECDDGAEALGTAICRPPDLVIMETQLSRISGFDLCRLLRADPATRSVPIVVVTTAATAADKLRATTAGANAVLTKPCSYEDVVAAARQLLDRASGFDECAPVDGSEANTGPSAVPLKKRCGSRSLHRERTTTPPRQPPVLHCPGCDSILGYDHSFIGGVSARSPEQWDYFVCRRCGPYQYRHRTRSLKRTT